MFDFWSDPLSTSILHVCEQRMLWRDMRSHPVRLDVWFLSDPSSLFILHVCEQRRLWRDCAVALARLSLLLIAYVVNTIISWAGSNGNEGLLFAISDFFFWFPMGLSNHGTERYIITLFVQKNNNYYIASVSLSPKSVILNRQSNFGKYYK